VARAEAYLHAKFCLDPSNCLATVHERHRQTDRTGQTDRQWTDSIGRTVLQMVAQKLEASVHLSVPQSQRASSLYPATDCAAATNIIIRCQRSLPFKPLNSRPAMSGSPSHRGGVRTVCRYQFTHVRYRTAAAGRAR